MASGKEIHQQDLPEDILLQTDLQNTDNHMAWQQDLANWARNTLNSGEQNLLNMALPEFEKVLIRETLTYTGGRKQEAAALLGWGRNTLTRKIKELDFDLQSDVIQ